MRPSPSSPHSPGGRPPSNLRGVPTSRAYWELKAEQMMNRLFDPAPAIDLESSDLGPIPAPNKPLPPAAAPASPGTDDSPSAAYTPAAAPAQHPNALPQEPAAVATAPAPAVPAAAPVGGRGKPRFEHSTLLLSSLAGVCMVSAVSSVLYLTHSNQVQQNLQQEHSLLLLERLRSLGPGSNAPPVVATTPPAPTLPAPVRPQKGAATAAAGELPPPPEEPWIEQLDRLPSSDTAPPLRVPVSPRLAAAAPQAPAPPRRAAAPAGPAPMLVGVVGAPGRAGSAIFQVGGSSSSVAVGETIPGSGWRLRSADGDSAVIEQAGETRQVRIGNGE